jgi:hypothetical protein
MADFAVTISEISSSCGRVGSFFSSHMIQTDTSEVTAAMAAKDVESFAMSMGLTKATAGCVGTWPNCKTGQAAQVTSSAWRGTPPFPRSTLSLEKRTSLTRAYRKSGSSGGPGVAFSNANRSNPPTGSAAERAIRSHRRQFRTKFRFDWPLAPHRSAASASTTLFEPLSTTAA